MCGITCAFDLKEDSSVLRPQLLEMSKNLGTGVLTGVVFTLTIMLYFLMKDWQL